jgi:phosphatidylserine/phosphatidylglycerophosphate/cardiolipin synthase-like enzyme
MRMTLKALIVVVTCLLIATAAHAFTVNVESICFSPQGGCTDRIVEKINAARSEILVQAYSFTSAPIAKAIVEAHKRGVKVEVILDKSQKKEKYTSATYLSNAGVPTYIDAQHAIAHNKVIVIDEQIVITGSFNFTKAAEMNNAENLLIINSGELARIYRANWNAHRIHSEQYHGESKK